MSNRLRLEHSPYLLQHAENPVDWQPWSPEVFEQARRLDRPVFLSIGYSTCHWCHVMAHESFEDREVAQAINESFLPVKVDREEHPDVDAVYMAACMAMTGSGGWPLTALLTPDQKPFWTGTYLPKAQLLQLLHQVKVLWRENRLQLLSAGDALTAYLRQEHEPPSVRPSQTLIRQAAGLFSREYDAQWGGFGPAPKFPMAHSLIFLLRFALLAGDAHAQKMAVHTLDAMYQGGLFDHVGGGFSRYSTDRYWLVPHFEKMLYDNALLALAYMEGFQHTRRPLYEKIARRTLDYLLEELSESEGGLCCGQDADSDGVEGKYYTLTPEELTQVLGPSDAKRFCQWYQITAAGNFEKKSIPNLLSQPHFEQEPEEMPRLRKQVYAYRRNRTALNRDDKVLTAWNGLALAALSRGGLVLEEARYLEAARRISTFLSEKMTTSDGRLLTRWWHGNAAHPGNLEDYAFYAWGLLEQYHATFVPACLSQAISLMSLLTDRFFDETHGGFFPYAQEEKTLLTRTKDAYDGAIPSGNAVAALVLSRLARLTGDRRWQEAAGRQMSWLSGMAQQDPAGHSFAMLAFLEELWPTCQLVVTAQEVPQELPAFLREFPRYQLTVLVKTPQTASMLEALAPFTKDYSIPAQGTQYYLCRDRSCFPPVHHLAQLRALLFQKSAGNQGNANPN